jgi:cell pole-organizing protein PopZ
MSYPAKAQEPSMEEILASIRRIIADDDAAKSPPPARDTVVPPPAQMTPAPPPPIPAPPPPAEAEVAKPAPPPPEPALPQEEIDALLHRREPPAEAATEPASDVLDLTEDMAAPDSAPPAEGFRTISAEPDIVFEDNPEPPPEHAVTDFRRQVEEPDRPLMSQMTSAAVDSAFNTLAHTVLVQNARTLEDLVREMLRPLLKTWLDDNLPGLVERLVRAEI